MTRWLPGAAFLLYLVGTVVLFYFGPWQYSVGHHGKLLVFLIAVHAALALGYLCGLRVAPRASCWRVSPRALALWAIGLELALLLPTSYYYTGSWIPPVWRALADLEQAYRVPFRRQLELTAYANYFRILAAPVLASSLPLGLFYWRRLGRAGRVALVVLVLGTLAMFVSRGTNKGVGEWAMVYPWCILAAHLSGELRMKRRAVVAAVAIGLASIALFIQFFGATMYARSGAAARRGTMESIGAVFAPVRDEVAAAPRSGTVVVNDPVLATVAGLTSYLTQGYYAVYLSLEEPFVPMWGIGHSLFLQRQAVRLTGNPAILERSYLERIEAKGWHAARSWATIYPWIASDVGFAGTVGVVFLIGWLLAALWIDVTGGRNPFAVAALGQVLLMLYYFPAHNRCLQTGEGVVAFWSLLLLWGLSRRGAD